MIKLVHFLAQATVGGMEEPGTSDSVLGTAVLDHDLVPLLLENSNTGATLPGFKSQLCDLPCDHG